ncbi:glycoside hydrolase family 35 protein [Apiospora arundinis]
MKLESGILTILVTGASAQQRSAQTTSAKPSSSVPQPLPSTVTSAAPSGSGTFTWDKSTFYINGQKHQIIGGQIDPQRVPRAYWGQRLQMAKAMGLNTILSYLYWQDIEKYPGKFDFTDRNDIAAWFQEIQNAGLKAVLRPGPYVCAERDWGGIPGWVSQLSGVRIRSNNQPFLNATSGYMAQVGAQVKPYLITNGGPILMVQIDNEYGYVGNDKNYLRAMADILKSNFPNMKLYTNDGAQSGALQGGSLPGALAVVDGTDSRGGFNLLRQVITDQSSVGPLMNGEYWVRWFDSWGPRNGHSSYDGDTNGQSGRANELDWVISNGNHISIFMFHGGTSWGFGNGAADAKPVQAFTTSYDYGAALDETGRPAQIYTAFRNAIAKRVAGIPAVPSTPGLMTVSDFALTPMLGMLDDLSSAKPRAASSPLVMEATGQVFGYILYEFVATGSASGAVTPGTGGTPRPHYRVRQRGSARRHRRPASVSVTLARGDKLWLLAENLGRADNGFSDQTKGILGDVSVGGTRLTGGTWNHYNFPLDTAPAVPTSGGGKTVAANGPPVWYRGTFTTSNSGMAADTFLQLPGGVKGSVFVNGHNLGRYWTVGPQQELFLPGAYLKQGEENVVLVLELEPGLDALRAAALLVRLQLLFRPRPQLLAQLLVLRLRGGLAVDGDGVVEVAGLGVGADGGPDLVLGALGDVGEAKTDKPIQRFHDKGERRVAGQRAPGELRVHGTRMHGDAADGGVALGQGARVVHVGELGDAVPGPGRRGGQVALEPRVGVGVGVLGRESLAQGRQAHDAHVGAGAALLGRREQRRQEQLGQLRVAHVVGAELDLVPFLGLARGTRHDARVVDEDVQLAGLREEVGGGALDAGEGRQVALDEGDGRRAGRALLDVLDCILGTGGVARSQVNMRWLVFGELVDGFLAQTDVATSHENGLPGEVRDVLVKIELHLGACCCYVAYDAQK